MYSYLYNNTPYSLCALGDPTVHGNLLCPHVLEEAVIEIIRYFILYKLCISLLNNDNLPCRNKTMNGYLPSVGYLPARKAIAQYSSLPDFMVDADDVIIASGCSGALELAITGMMDPGSST